MISAAVEAMLMFVVLGASESTSVSHPRCQPETTWLSIIPGAASWQTQALVQSFTLHDQEVGTAAHF